MSSYILHAIGIGPGDPELLTLKAVRLLKEARCVIVPKGKEEGTSLALSIASGAVDLSDKEIVEAHFPMVKTREEGFIGELDSKWDLAADSIVRAVKRFHNVVFITLGDPSIYSTFYYVYDRILKELPEIKVSFVPGISSVNTAACSASVALTLGRDKMALLPATYTNEELSKIINHFDTLVLMKTHRVFDRIRQFLEQHHLIDKAIYVSHAGMEDEKIFRDIRQVKESDLNYFSIIIVKL